MARRKVTCALQLENWQQADDALRQIGENRRDLAAIENELNERIAGYEQDSTHLTEHPKPAEGIAPMVLGVVIYTERENAGKALDNDRILLSKVEANHEIRP